jgi:hypothetical protein
MLNAGRRQSAIVIIGDRRHHWHLVTNLLSASLTPVHGKFTADVAMTIWKFWIPVWGAPCFASMYRRLFRSSKEKNWIKIMELLGQKPEVKNLVTLSLKGHFHLSLGLLVSALNYYYTLSKFSFVVPAGGPVRQPYIRVDHIPQLGTKNFATNLGKVTVKRERGITLPPMYTKAINCREGLRLRLLKDCLRTDGTYVTFLGLCYFFVDLSVRPAKAKNRNLVNWVYAIEMTF